MSTLARPDPYAPSGVWRTLESAAAGLLAILWVLPLAYAVWAAFHPAEFTTRFSLFAPLTLENFERAWIAAPFARYFFNTFVLVTLTLGCQLVPGLLPSLVGFPVVAVIEELDAPKELFVPRGVVACQWLASLGDVAEAMPCGVT